MFQIRGLISVSEGTHTGILKETSDVTCSVTEVDGHDVYKFPQEK